MARHVACMGEIRNAYNILVREDEGKRPVRRSTHRWENNIKMGLKEIGRDGVNWIHVVLDRDQQWAFVNMVMNLKRSIKRGSF
jgi:hypothetical protein